PDPGPTWASRIGMSPERLGTGPVRFFFWGEKTKSDTERRRKLVAVSLCLRVSAFKEGSPQTCKRPAARLLSARPALGSGSSLHPALCALAGAMETLATPLPATFPPSSDALSILRYRINASDLMCAPVNPHT